MGQEVDARTDIFAVGIILWELLAGQRLFLGETDFQTVKKVQQAVVPPHLAASTRRSRRSSSRSSTKRSRAIPTRGTRRRASSAGLSKFMFKYGVPVSTFDIASARAGRDAGARSGTARSRLSIIDKLIEEALFEFTSLTDDKAAPGTDRRPTQGPPAGPEAPRRRGPAWVDVDRSARGSTRIAGGAKPRTTRCARRCRRACPRATSPRSRTTTSARRPRRRAAVLVVAVVVAVGPSVRAGRARSCPRRRCRRSLEGEKRSAPTKVGVVVALVVVMAAGAAAWFTHLIPHQ